MESCLKCTNSACCKLLVEVSRLEYDNISGDLKKNFVKYSDEFILKSPIYESKKQQIDDMYSQTYAYLPKENDGLCKLLDRDTMLCSVYDQRPQACKDYGLNRCKQIRNICTD